MLYWNNMKHMHRLRKLFDCMFVMVSTESVDEKQCKLAYVGDEGDPDLNYNKTQAQSQWSLV